MALKKYNGEPVWMFYIASGWFNARQAEDLTIIKKTLDAAEVKYFSPMDEVICPPNADDAMRREVFEHNMFGIHHSKFMIVNTRDKDMGTIFEAGVAYQNKKKIIYVAFGLEGDFNLMLAQSGICVCRTVADLERAVKKSIENPDWSEVFTGTIE